MARPLLLLALFIGSLAIGHAGADQATLVNGPDLVAGIINGPEQFGSSGTQVGLALGPTECNAGNVEIDAFGLPDIDHAVIAQNLYRMNGGAENNERFEQIGQSWVKHRAGAKQSDACGYGCIPAADFTRLGAGCSDAYDAGTGAMQNGLGSRAWVNPFTGEFSSNANNHNGHTHTGTSHRLAVEAGDLDNTINPGASYFFELQYITPHEYAWCQAHPAECNMYNNASYRPYFVSGTTAFTFSPGSATAVGQPALNAWTGATIQLIEPAPGVDGVGYLAYKVTGPINGLWHYEYAVYNQNLDRAVQSFTVPLGCGVTASNLGFHAPLNDPGFANDGTLGDSGYSNAAWISSQAQGALTWNSETFAQNQNANAIRWGTLFNFRFDSNRPPQSATATLAFFKTGSPASVVVAAPAPDACAALEMTSAVSRKTHGSAGAFDIALPLNGTPGIEPRVGGGNHVLVFSFTNQVVSGSASVTAGTGTVSGTASFSGNTMTINLTGVADAQQVTISLASVTDSFGQVLLTAPVKMSLLVGDTNGNGVVNTSDIAQVKAQAGAAITEVNFREDLTADGALSASDIALVKSRSGNQLIGSLTKQRRGKR